MAKLKHEFEKIVNNLIQEHNIIVEKWRTTNSGVAYDKCKTIQIPKPISIGRFMTCIHEIEHIINPIANKTTVHAYEAEYLACKASEDVCVKYGFRVPLKESKRNRNYVKMIICKGLRRNGNINNISEHILNYADINKAEWLKELNKGNKPFVQNVKGIWEEVEVLWDNKNNIIDEIG